MTVEIRIITKAITKIIDIKTIWVIIKVPTAPRALIIPDNNPPANFKTFPNCFRSFLAASSSVSGSSSLFFSF